MLPWWTAAGAIVVAGIVAGIVIVSSSDRERAHRTTADRCRIVNNLDSTIEGGCATLLS
jgi:hypothetical protein